MVCGVWWMVCGGWCVVGRVASANQSPHRNTGTAQSQHSHKVNRPIHRTASINQHLIGKHGHDVNHDAGRGSSFFFVGRHPDENNV